MSEGTRTRRRFLQRVGATSVAALAAGSARTFGGGAAQPAATPPAAAPATMGARFRRLLREPEPIVSPIVYDLMSAKLTASLGFPTLFAGGQPASNAMYGVGDHGLITITELIEFAARVAGAVDVPVMADADDGGGSPLSVYRAMRAYARANVGCVMIEDMSGAKHVPNRPEGPMTATAAMVDRLGAAVEARGPDGPVIVARTDALSANESFDEARRRLVAYAEAGAEVVFMAGATPAQCAEIADATARPVLSTSRAPLATLAAHRVKIAAVGLQLFALEAVRLALEDLRRSGEIPDAARRELPAAIYRRLTDADRWTELSARFNAQRAQ